MRPARLPLLILLSAALAACGERTFTAEEFVDEVNAEGAAIALGGVITTNQDGLEIREVTFTESVPSATGAGEEAQGSGAMVVLDDAGAAGDELERCEAAPAFTCFRAANVLLRFERIFPEEQARIIQAFQAIASE